MNVAESSVSDRILTDRLVLEPAGLCDSVAVQAFFVDNKAFHAPWEPERDRSYYKLVSVTTMLERQHRVNRDLSGLHLYLRLHDDPAVIGTVALTAIVYGPFLSCFLGYRMARLWTCRGYMSEAVAAVIDIAFNRYGLHRIEANIMPENRASIRVVEKLGFTNEGFSPRYLKVAGVWEGHAHYVLLSDAAQQWCPPCRNAKNE